MPVGRSATGRPRAGKSSPSAAGRGGAARAGGAEGGAVPGLGPLSAGAGALPGRGAGGARGAGHSQRQPWAGRHKGSVTRLPERRRSPGNRPLPLYPGASPGWGRGGAGVSAGACPSCPGALLGSAPVPMRAAAAALAAPWALAGGPSGRWVASLRARPGPAGAAPERHELGAAPRLAIPGPL